MWMQPHKHTSCEMVWSQSRAAGPRPDCCRCGPDAGGQLWFWHAGLTIAAPHTVASAYYKSSSFVVTVSTAFMVGASLNQDLCSEVKTSEWSAAMTLIIPPAWQDGTRLDVICSDMTGNNTITSFYLDNPTNITPYLKTHIWSQQRCCRIWMSVNREYKYMIHLKLSCV